MVWFYKKGVNVMQKNENNMVHNGNNGGGMGFCGLVVAIFVALCLFAFIG